MQCGSNRANGACVIAPLMAVVVLIMNCASASAQSVVGPFAEFNTWWVHPSLGTLGVAFDGVNIQIDRDGDGTTDATFAPPPSMPIAARSSLRLSRSIRLIPLR